MPFLSQMCEAKYDKPAALSAAKQVLPPLQGDKVRGWAQTLPALDAAAPAAGCGVDRPYQSIKTSYWIEVLLAIIVF